MNVIRFAPVPNGSVASNQTRPNCHQAHTTEAVVLFTLAGLGMGANILLMALILLRRPLRRWSQGLLFHQGLVDCARASLLVPLGISVIVCQRFPRCSAIETVFLLLVTVSTVNMLTSVINDAPLLPDHPSESGPRRHHQHHHHPPIPQHHLGHGHQHSRQQHHRRNEDGEYATDEEEDEGSVRRAPSQHSRGCERGLVPNRGRRGSHASSFSSSTTTSGGRSSTRRGADQRAADNGTLLDSPQCIVFGLFIIWFASVTINLGPTFLSGALASSSGGMTAASHVDACPMVVAPVRHYVLNALWVTVNLLCVSLTAIHLRKLYRDLSRSNLEAVRIAGMVTTMIAVRTDPPPSTEHMHHYGNSAYFNQVGSRDPRNYGGGYQQHHHIHNYIHRLEREGIRRVKMFVIILVAYILFWGPLYTLTLIHPAIVSMTSSSASAAEAEGTAGRGVGGATLTYEVTLHVAFVHAFVNPTLLLVFHKDLRKAAGELARCKNWLSSDSSDRGGPAYESATSYCSAGCAGSLGRDHHRPVPAQSSYENGEMEDEDDDGAASAYMGSYHSLAFRGGYM